MIQKRLLGITPAPAHHFSVVTQQVVISLWEIESKEEKSGYPELGIRSIIEKKVSSVKKSPSNFLWFGRRFWSSMSGLQLVENLKTIIKIYKFFALAKQSLGFRYLTFPFASSKMKFSIHLKPPQRIVL